MKDTRAIGILLILFIATLCPAEGAQFVTIDSKDYASLDTATEGYFYVKLDDSPSNVVLNFDIKFEALSFFDPKNIISIISLNMLIFIIVVQTIIRMMIAH